MLGIGFISMLSKQNLDKNGCLVLGNIEALSQTETNAPEQGKRKHHVEGECEYKVGDEIRNGVLVVCDKGDGICSLGCVNPN